MRKLQCFSLGGYLIQNSNSATDSLLYTNSDAQGSLIALTDANGGIVRKYAYDPWGVRRNASNWNTKDNGDHLIVNRGYTGHEHLDAFGIINMNGRVYDPLTAMFFSPDPALIGSNWLSYNRYGYCMGNPFKYTDPSGNNPFLLGLAAVIGGVVNLGIQMISGNIHNVGQFFGAFGVGALAGITGSWIGGLTSTALGTATTLGSAIGNGALIGAGAGTAGGFIGGAGNAWVNGAGFGDGLMAGFVGGLTGGITGGILGGIGGGISYSKEEAAFRVAEKNMGLKPGAPIQANDDNLNRFTDYWYKSQYPDAFKTVDVWTHDHPTQEALDAFATKTDAAGYTSAAKGANGNYTGRSSVFFSDKAFLSSRQLYYTIGHELTHVGQFAYLGSIGFSYQKGLADALEIGAYGWESSVGGSSYTSNGGAARFMLNYPYVAEKIMGTYNYTNFHPDFCPIFETLSGPKKFGW